jgi:hypothetical protein
MAAADEDEESEERETDAIEASRDWLGGIPAAPTEDWEIGFGGRLYDNWFEALAVDEPEETHPAYPAVGQQEGAATWRCKECHGWDYKGRDGEYGSGSHATGIVGIQAMVGADPSAIRAIIEDDTHGYTPEMIPPEAMDRLARFVTRGQHETALYFDYATGRALGEAEPGERYYQNICAPCHGFDGRRWNSRAIRTIRSTSAPWRSRTRSRPCTRSGTASPASRCRRCASWPGRTSRTSSPTSGPCRPNSAGRGLVFDLACAASPVGSDRGASLAQGRALPR